MGGATITMAQAEARSAVIKAGWATITIKGQGWGTYITTYVRDVSLSLAGIMALRAITVAKYY